MDQFQIVEENGTRYIQMEPWTMDRLFNQLEPPGMAKFEHSIYGAMNLALLQQFPFSVKFMVKPQGLYRCLNEIDDTAVRMDYEPQNANNEVPQAAADINVQVQVGAEDVQMNEPQPEVEPVPGPVAQAAPRHRGHDVKTSGGNIGGDLLYIPDYIVVKATSELGYDITLCLLEIKRNNLTETASVRQIVSYLQRAAKENLVVGKLWGFLVLANRLRVFEINTELSKHWNAFNVQEVTAQLLVNGQLNSNRAEFLGLLHRICRRYVGERNEGWRQYAWEPEEVVGEQ